MKVAVIGSRGFSDQQKLFDALSNISQYEPMCEQISLIISGGAKGADQLAETYAKKHGIQTQVFLPDYKHFGRGAPLKRNELIIQHCDLVVAFWDGKSTGTKNALDHAKRLGKKAIVINTL